MDNLKKRSLRVRDGMQVYYPQFDESNTIIIQPGFTVKYNGCYSINNATVAFVDNGEVYVTPYTSEVYKTLLENEFRASDFYVPFSNWDIPVDAKAQGFWQGLREAASEYYNEEFIKDCEKWCDDHYIGEIDKEQMFYFLKLLYNFFLLLLHL